MKVYRSQTGIILERNGQYAISKHTDWDALVNRPALHQVLSEEFVGLDRLAEKPENLLAPIGSQEVWAAGVTYFRSREARMEESKESGAAVFYSKVYEAERPELFFKSAASRVAGPGEKVLIRRDSKWNVPEPELTLFINNQNRIAGYTIGNDMSSRDIEGENPLYLPQAKCYDRSAGIGPCLLVPESPIDPDAKIHMAIERRWKTVFSGSISINQMKRKHTELVDFLTREMTFPQGAYLMTGTCLVPNNSFSLEASDIVHIDIEGIGRLSNIVDFRP